MLTYNGSLTHPAPAALDKMAARLANEIESDLARRGWPQGTQVGTEPELLKQYGVSRAVFREAIRIGEHRGIMRMQRGPRGGLIVGLPSMEQVTAVAAVYMLRQRMVLGEVLRLVRVIAPVITKLAADRISDSELSQLQRLVRAETSSPEHHAAFRAIVATASRNPVADLFSDAQTRLVLPALKVPGAIDPAVWTVVQEYQRLLVRAFAERDSAAATQLVNDFLDRASSYSTSLREQPIVTVDTLQNFSDPRGTKLAEITANRIISDIVDADLPVGHMVGSEPELMTRFGVSRAAFREAIRLVEHHQIARMRRGPGGGLVVVHNRVNPIVQSCATYLDFRRVTVSQLLEMRRPIEKVAISRVIEAARTNPAIDADLDRVLAAEREAGFDLPSEFSLHVALGDRSGDRALAVVIRILAEISDRHLPNRDSSEDVRNRLKADSERFHRAIIDAIRSRDVDTACAEMTQHLHALGPFMR